jgi:hypothetical protein
MPYQKKSGFERRNAQTHLKINNYILPTQLLFSPTQINLRFSRFIQFC